MERYDLEVNESNTLGVSQFSMQSSSVCSIGRDRTKMSCSKGFINVLLKSYNKNMKRKTIHTYAYISKCHSPLLMQS